MNYDNWIKPKNCITIKYFIKKSKNKTQFEDDDNKWNTLIDEDENNDEEEDRIKNKRKSKRMEEKVKIIMKSKRKTLKSKGMTAKQESAWRMMDLILNMN